MRKGPAVALAVVAVAALIAAAVFATLYAREESSVEVAASDACGDRIFGHIASLSRKHGRWVMRFDPALLLRGATAAQAALEDTGSSDVPNDSYTLEESHRLLTYVVSPTATVTVLLDGLRPIEIPVSELAGIVRGKNPMHRALFDRARGLGYWIRVGDKYPNPVLSIDQQYHP